MPHFVVSARIDRDDADLVIEADDLAAATLLLAEHWRARERRRYELLDGDTLWVEWRNVAKLVVYGVESFGK